MVKIISLLILGMFVYTTTSRVIPVTCPGRNLLSTIATLVELSEADSCGCQPSCTCGCKNAAPLPCSCKTCKKEPQYIDVILPPVAAELPCGLGYFSSAAPLAALAYGCTSPCDSCIPITSPYSCTALATPLCAEMRAFAKPVIL